MTTYLCSTPTPLKRTFQERSSKLWVRISEMTVTISFQKMVKVMFHNLQNLFRYYRSHHVIFQVWQGHQFNFTLMYPIPCYWVEGRPYMWTKLSLVFWIPCTKLNSERTFFMLAKQSLEARPYPKKDLIRCSSWDKLIQDRWDPLNCITISSVNDLLIWSKKY